MHVVGQVVDRGEPDPGGRPVGDQRVEINIVDRAVAIAVDEVDEAAADPLDRRDVQFHRPELAVHRLGAELDRAVVGRGGVLDAERDRADRGPVQARESLRKALGLGVQDEIDIALLVERDVFRAVPRRRDKPHLLEQGRQLLRVGAGVFDELEPVRSHRVVPEIVRGITPGITRGRVVAHRRSPKRRPPDVVARLGSTKVTPIQQRPRLSGCICSGFAARPANCPVAPYPALKPCSACNCRLFAGGRTSPAASARVPFCCICSALCSKIPPHRFTLERER